MVSNKYIIFFLMLIVAVSNAQTPTKYWVKLKDKNNSPYSINTPSAFLSPKSIQRRANQNISVD